MSRALVVPNSIEVILMVSVYCGILNTFRWAGACRGKDTTSTARSTDDNLLEQRELSVITLFCILIIRLYGIVIFIRIGLNRFRFGLGFRHTQRH